MGEKRKAEIIEVRGDDEHLVSPNAGDEMITCERLRSGS